MGIVFALRIYECVWFPTVFQMSQYLYREFQLHWLDRRTYF